MAGAGVDPLCDGYRNIRYGHPFVLRLYELFSFVAVRDCRFIHDVILSSWNRGDKPDQRRKPRRPWERHLSVKPVRKEVAC